MKAILLPLLCLIVQPTYSQAKDDQYFVFDKNWKPVDIAAGVYLLRIRPSSDKGFQCVFYNLYGPRLREENYSDSAGKVRNGSFFYYYSTGRLDSAGQYEDNMMNGAWRYYNEEGHIIRRKNYNKGVLTSDTSFSIVQNILGKKKEPVPGEVESEFKGGPKSWIRFLTNNFQYPPRAYNSQITGEVQLEFMIDENGKLKNADIYKSVEYSIDEEALRIMNKSPVWLPATKDGKNVKSYKRQPIIFSLAAQ